MIRPSRFRHMFGQPLPAVALIVLAGCAEDSLVLPDQGQPAAIEVLGGNGQQGMAGAPLTDSLTVRVTDSRDRPVQDVPVAFTPAAGGRTVPDTALTDADGRASGRWILGPSAGDQTLTAKPAGQPGLAATFTATAIVIVPDPGMSSLSASPSVISASAGSSSSTLTVTARDDQGNVLPGVTVELFASGNGVNLTQPAGPTDSNGIATGALSSTATGFKNVSATLDGTPMVQTALVIVVPAGGNDYDDDDDD